MRDSKSAAKALPNPDMIFAKHTASDESIGLTELDEPCGICEFPQGNYAGEQHANPFHIGKVYTIEGWRYWLLAWPAAMFIRLYYATLRIKMDAEDEQALRDNSRPIVGIVWHNRSFVTPLIMRLARVKEKTVSLISPSKAAAWEVAIFKALDLPSVRGSSNRRSIQAVRDMLKISKNGDDIFIAPDGPSGPLYDFKRGAAATARMSGSRILLVGAECRSAWRANTWDRHLFPLPFSKLRLKAIMLENEDVFDGKRSDDEACELLSRKLRSINDDFTD